MKEDNIKGPLFTKDSDPNSRDKIIADCIVVGGGLAGIFSAIAFKRTASHKKVWLIERLGFLGGMATAGYVYPFMRYWAETKNGKRRLVGGLFWELIEILERRGYIQKKGTYRGYPTRFDPMMIRVVLDEMCQEAGVSLLFHATVNKVNVEGSHIKEIEIQTKKGSIKAKASVFIDATGDADLIYHSGAPYFKGRKQDGLVQPATLNFRLGNLSLLPSSPRKIGKKVREYKKKGGTLTPRDDCLCFKGLEKRIMHFNQTRVAGFDFTDPFQMTQAELEGRKQARAFIDFLRSNIRGYKKSTVISFGSVLGIRETRRILGEYILTEEDLKSGELFEDRIALSNYPIDIHDPAGSKNTTMIHFPKGHIYSIPFRSLLPKTLTNVVVVGRPISTTHVAHSAIRIMPTCSAIGHAGGIAAALALLNYEEDAKNTPLNIKNISVKELQKIARSQGAILE